MSIPIEIVDLELIESGIRVQVKVNGELSSLTIAGDDYIINKDVWTGLEIEQWLLNAFKRELTDLVTNKIGSEPRSLSNFPENLGGERWNELTKDLGVRILNGTDKCSRVQIKQHIEHLRMKFPKLSGIQVIKKHFQKIFQESRWAVDHFDTGCLVKMWEEEKSLAIIKSVQEVYNRSGPTGPIGPIGAQGPTGVTGKTQ
jgi:hypothetical protein